MAVTEATGVSIGALRYWVDSHRAPKEATDSRIRVGQVNLLKAAALLAGFSASVFFLVLAYFPTLVDVRSGSLSDRFVFFWLGMAGVILISALLFFGARLSDRVCLAVLGTSAVVTFLPKLFRSLDAPPYWDELLHLGQARILETGIVLGHNVEDPTVGYFPVYQLLFVGLHDLTRLSLWHSDLAIAECGHITLVLAIYLLVRELSSSTRIASIAAVIYLAGPSVSFWLSEGSYETIGLPAAVLTAYFSLRAARNLRSAWPVLSIIGMILTALTQPVSGLFLVAFLLLLGIVDSGTPASGYSKLFSGRMSSIVAFGIASLAINLAWIGATAWYVVWPYILPTAATLHSAIHAISNYQHPRDFYAASRLPAYETFIGSIELVIVPLVVLFGFWQFFRHKLIPRGPTRDRLALGVFCVLSAIYLVTYPFALSASAAVFVHRSWDLLWIGISGLFAYLLDGLLSPRFFPVKDRSSKGLGVGDPHNCPCRQCRYKRSSDLRFSLSISLRFRNRPRYS